MPTESVWDYPRPPRLEHCKQKIRVVCNDTVVADSTRAVRILEKSQPPTYYIPPFDVKVDYLRRSFLSSTVCEFKGVATYWHLVFDKRVIQNAAWTYDSPTKEYSAISGYFAFYASDGVKCFVGDVLVTPQSSDYYGGWVTPEIEGPFKCVPGTKDEE